MSTNTSQDKPHAFNPPDVAKPPPTYNQVAITPFSAQTKFITLAGQTGVIPATGQMEPTFIEQVRRAYSNVAKCLQAAGATPRDIVHVRHYIVDRGDDQTDVVERGWGTEWTAFMDREGEGHRPPDTVLGVASLAKKDIYYEVEVWAVVNGSA